MPQTRLRELLSIDIENVNNLEEHMSNDSVRTESANDHIPPLLVSPSRLLPVLQTSMDVESEQPSIHLELYDVRVSVGVGVWQLGVEDQGKISKWMLVVPTIQSSKIIQILRFRLCPVFPSSRPRTETKSIA